jgi:threonine/homoserine/homoserine lactone efflux protein
MPSLVAALVFGAVFGLALAAPPGPMNAVIAQESVIRGWFAGFAAGLGAMTADAVFFVLAYLGAVRAVEAVPVLRDAMVGVGGMLLLCFAYAAARDASADWTPADAPDGRGFWKALVLALTNPYQIVFWLTVGVGLLQPGTVDVLAHTPYVGGSLAGTVVVRTGSPALLVGFFGGIAVWITGFPASLVVAGRRVDRFAPMVAYASAAVLVAFGGWFLADATGLLG